jgi:uncharacterized protein YjbI with pentapeptide repeats
MTLDQYKGTPIRPGAELSWADLFGADLSEANLSGANLFGANLFGADLSRAKYNDATIFPDWPKTFGMKKA